jgi:transposase-like protein
VAANIPLSAEEKAEITRLHGEGKSVRQVAEAIDRAPSTVSRHAGELGLVFDRAQTDAATFAAMADNRARRAAIVEWQYERCLRLAERLGAPTFETVGNSQEGPVAAEFGFVPPQDELHLSRALASYAKTAADLEKVDAGHGSESLVSAIGDIGAALTAVAASFESGDDGGA